MSILWLDDMLPTWLKYLTAVLVVAAASLYFYTKKTYRYFEERGVKSLPCVPIFGNFYDSMYKKTKHRSHVLNEMYYKFSEEKYFGIYEAYTPLIVIKDPEMIKKVTVKDFDHFSDHRNFVMADHDDLWASSLFFMKGQKWREMRSTLSPAFTGSKMRHMLPFMTEISKNIVEHLHQQTKVTAEGKITDPVDMNDLFTRYANDVIASCVFGCKVDSLKDRDNHFYTVGHVTTTFTPSQAIKLSIISIFPIIFSMFKLQVIAQSTRDFLNELIFGAMKQREKNNIFRPDMIQILMEAKNGTLKHDNAVTDDKIGFATVDEYIKDTNFVKKWTDVELLGQAFIFFFAGFATVSTALTFTIHELTLNPEVQEKLREEIDECHANKKEVTYEVIQGLKYLDMVLSESLRKWPPSVIMNRKCIKEYTLEPSRPGARPVTLKPNDCLYVPTASLHMDEKYFPNPQKFDPERFSDERKHEIKPFTYMPFGSGPRNCIGSRFALMEVKVLLYHLILEFELVPCSKTSNPVRLRPHDSKILTEGDTWIRLKSRK